MTARFRTLADLSRALRARQVTATDVTQRCLDRIAERNPSLNAFIAVYAESALAAAHATDGEIATGRYRGPLHGVPISLKDLIDVRGLPTTAASRVRDGHVAAADAVVTARLREAGAIIVGKTNLHEFAFGTTNEDSAFGPVRHPLDPERSPGGSSGGSAASVLDDMAYASIGTDTGGSIRIPAAACGLVGLKPGLGEIPTGGVVPLSATMDHLGPLCRSVEDAGLLYAVLRGTVDPEPWTARDVRGLRLGVPRPYFFDQLDTEVADRFDDACQRLSRAGAILEDVAIAHAADIGPVYLHLVLPEAAAYHAETLEHRAGDYTPNVRIRLEMGRYVLAEDYLRARLGREVLTGDVDSAVDGRDGLLLPTLAVPAIRLGAATVRVGASDEPVRNITLRLTQLFNITGHPALTLPCGRTGTGLPVGAQLVGARGRTLDLLRVAAAVEPSVSLPS
jgi:aspartyl-tRNA(Asn)/glutamyl-tRNA(Gln) amidotransferase subunit A